MSPVGGGWGTHTPARDHGVVTPPHRCRTRCAGHARSTHPRTTRRRGAFIPHVVSVCDPHSHDGTVIPTRRVRSQGHPRPNAAMPRPFFPGRCRSGAHVHGATCRDGTMVPPRSPRPRCPPGDVPAWRRVRDGRWARPLLPVPVRRDTHPPRPPTRPRATTASRPHRVVAVRGAGAIRDANCPGTIQTIPFLWGPRDAGRANAGPGIGAGCESRAA